MAVQFPRKIVTVGQKASSSSTDKVLLNKRAVPVTATDFKHIPNATLATNPSQTEVDGIANPQRNPLVRMATRIIAPIPPLYFSPSDPFHSSHFQFRNNEKESFHKTIPVHIMKISFKTN